MQRLAGASLAIDGRRGRVGACLLALTLLLGWLVGAVAAEDPTPSDRDPAKVDILTYPWSSIAKLNNSVGESCTASAIDAVLTAAHSIFNQRTNRFLPPSSLHVLFGYERGHYAIHALVNSYAIARL
jgi:protease YdgD